MTADRPWPGDPGVPLHPERDGWHWLQSARGIEPWAWGAAEGGSWVTADDVRAMMAARDAAAIEAAAREGAGDE